MRTEAGDGSHYNPGQHKEMPIIPGSSLAHNDELMGIVSLQNTESELPISQPAPRRRTEASIQKDREIATLQSQGMPHVEIAEAVGLSPTRVGRRIAAMEGRESQQWTPPSEEARAGLQAAIAEHIEGDTSFGVTALAREYSVTSDIARGEVDRAMDNRTLQMVRDLFPDASATVSSEGTSRNQTTAIVASMDATALREAYTTASRAKSELVDTKRATGASYSEIKGAPSIRAVEMIQEIILDQERKQGQQ